MFLIIFIQKIERLTSNSIFHDFYDDVINVIEKCIHYRGTVARKRFTNGQKVKILGQKNREGKRGSASPLPPTV